MDNPAHLPAEQEMFVRSGGEGSARRLCQQGTLVGMGGTCLGDGGAWAGYLGEVGGMFGRTRQRDGADLSRTKMWLDSV